ncbi:MAG TPA: I78 family peptidase inhibitor [Caulobacterales bacterium]|nr:I78 family peptidase inhibitor [Caulobacterales bacterium]
MIRWSLASALLMVSACTSAPQTYRDLDQISRQEQAALGRNSGQANPQDTCGMAAFQGLVGKPADEIDQSSLPPRTRIIRPGMMITQDFSPQRLNIRVAPDGKVSELGCF